MFYIEAFAIILAIMTLTALVGGAGFAWGWEMAQKRGEKP